MNVKFPVDFWPDVNGLLLFDGEGGLDRPCETPLVKHISLACQYITEPPLTTVDVDILGVYEIEITNPAGVTMWDVVYQIAQKYAIALWNFGSLINLCSP